MARVKITEFRAKALIYDALSVPYFGLSLQTVENYQEKIDSLSSDKLYVLKVDQGIKKRMKQGLVSLRLKKNEIKQKVDEFSSRGFNRFIIEEFLPHERESEKYLSFQREREGIVVYASEFGGIDVEESVKKVNKFILEEKTREDIARILHVPVSFIKTLHQVFDTNYFSFLEINPLVVLKDKVILLDVASQVDSAAEFFMEGAWGEADIVTDAQVKIPEEKAVLALKKKSPAALSLTVINPHGSIFMLLSGGGASLVLADEVYNLGAADELANYGEYSGNPNEEETYLYTKELISLMKKSSASGKVLIIGGGVANFTDIRVTFKGVVRALEVDVNYFKKQKVRIYVRRGGPHQSVGLLMMKTFLEKNNIENVVSGPEMPLQEIVQLALHKK